MSKCETLPLKHILATPPEELAVSFLDLEKAKQRLSTQNGIELGCTIGISISAMWLTAVVMGYLTTPEMQIVASAAGLSAMLGLPLLVALHQEERAKNLYEAIAIRSGR